MLNEYILILAYIWQCNDRGRHIKGQVSVCPLFIHFSELERSMAVMSILSQLQFCRRQSEIIMASYSNVVVVTNSNGYCCKCKKSELKRYFKYKQSICVFDL